MAKKLFVGNLSWGVNSDQLRELFEQFGTVSDAVVLEERDTGRSRGFGFVTFDDDAAAEKAIEELHGSDLDGRDMVVNEARPREPRRDNGGYGGGYGGNRY